MELERFVEPPSLPDRGDDLVPTASRIGAVTNMAFLSIIDGECFTPAPCLCCCAAVSLARAREISPFLRLFRAYYSTESYLKSKAFRHVVDVLSRDLRPGEVAEVKAHLRRVGSTPEIVRMINRADGLCVAAPPCRPSGLWVYSTPLGRRLLRHVSRAFRAEGESVRVSVASSDPDVFPRFRYRMYAAAFDPALSQKLLSRALAWTLEHCGKKRAPAFHGAGPSSSPARR